MFIVQTFSFCFNGSVFTVNQDLPLFCFTPLLVCFFVHQAFLLHVISPPYPRSFLIFLSSYVLKLFFPLLFKLCLFHPFFQGALKSHLSLVSPRWFLISSTPVLSLSKPFDILPQSLFPHIFTSLYTIPCD